MLYELAKGSEDKFVFDKDKSKNYGYAPPSAEKRPMPEEPAMGLRWLYRASVVTPLCLRCDSNIQKRSIRGRTETQGNNLP